MKRSNRSSHCWMLGLTLLSGGCASVGPTITCKSATNWERGGGLALVGETYGARVSPIPLNSVLFDSPETAGSIAIHHLTASRTPADTVEVAARFVNCLDHAQRIEVRTSFFRLDGANVEEPSAWQTVFVPAASMATYAERSLATEGIGSFLIEVRSPPVAEPRPNRPDLSPTRGAISP